MNQTRELRLDPWRLANMVSVLGITILFPGFLLFHYLVAALGLTFPPFLSGLFGPASAAVAVMFAITVPMILAFRSKVISVYALSVAGYIAYCFLWSLGHYLWLEESYVSSAFVQSYQTVVFWIALFFTGYFLPRNVDVVRRLFWAAFWLILGFLAFYAVQTGELMFYAQRAYGVEEVATYQGFARSALIILLALISWSKELAHRLFISVGGTFALFMLGSRSEFYAYVATATAVMLILSLRDRRIFLGAILFTVGIVSLLAIGYDHMTESRQFEVLSLSESSSWQSRMGLSEVAIGQVFESPVFGYFGGHIAEAGGGGSYAHNLLSAWVNYGLPGLVWYVALAVTALAASFRNLLKDGGRDPVWLLSFATNFTCVLLILAAKSVFWPVAALGWGVYARALLLSSDSAPESASEPSPTARGHILGSPFTVPDVRSMRGSSA